MIRTNKNCAHLSYSEIEQVEKTVRLSESAQVSSRSAPEFPRRENSTVNFPLLIPAP